MIDQPVNQLVHSTNKLYEKTIRFKSQTLCEKIQFSKNTKKKDTIRYMEHLQALS
jgi:hypothetical protein